jgi:hypothetical protein
VLGVWHCDQSPKLCTVSAYAWRGLLIELKRFGCLDAVVLSNNILRLVAVPELGGKIVSLIRQQSGYEYLLQGECERQYRRVVYGEHFENGATSGFDECMPTIAKCRYPEEPFSGKQLPDHGDLWCMPAKFEAVGDQVRFTTSIASLPLRFTKFLELQGSSVRLHYEVTNLSQSTVKFLWSAHPLLNVQPKAEIVLPAHVNELEVSWSKGGRLGQLGARCAWPRTRETSGRIIDLSKVLEPNAGTADKLFTAPLPQGFCGMFLPEVNESIAFRFDPELVPYVGIWICHGGWPPSRAAKQFTVALEPCTGRPDSLEQAIQRKECSMVGGLDSKRWWLQIDVGSGALQAS